MDRRIAEVWGVVRDTPADRKAAMAKYKKMLLAARQTTPAQVALDRSLGRAIFAKTCQQCHTLYGIGGKVGPDITGSNRSNLDYLLENILDPSAVIPKEYAATPDQSEERPRDHRHRQGRNGRGVDGRNGQRMLTVSKADIDTREPSASP